ncbi:MAG: hypothetical protein JWR69_2579 [Pedosphaera sp.]|nr:hypothetical protein [Pedosphaera sp.]
MFQGNYCNMKLSNILKQLLVTTAISAALAGTPALAQMPGSGPSSSMNAAMSKLFGSNNAFTSKAELHVLDKANKETTRMPMGFNMLDGKTRLDLDLTQIKSSQLPAATIASLKQMGMDQLVTIIRPDKKATLLIYPSLKSYAEIAMSSEEAAEANKNFKIEKTKLGKETIDGHACDKSKVVLTDDKGQKQTAIAWNAADLRDFPVQLQMTEQDNTVVMKFKEIKLGRPDAKQFEAPAGLTRYDSAEKLMKAVVLKGLGGAGGQK